MKYLKKTLSFVLAFAMAFTMVIVPRGSSGSVADAATEEVRYFYADMYKYDTEKFNALSKQKAREQKKNTNTAIQFNDGNGSKTYNKYNNKNVTKGIVANEFVDGKIKFNYSEAGIFENNNSENASGEKTKEFYTNVGIPFKKDGDYYYFDSNKYDAYFGTDKYNKLAPGNGVNLENGTNTDGPTQFFNSGDWASHDTTGFFPFNGKTEYDSQSKSYKRVLSTSNNDGTLNIKTKPVYHFGMSMSIPFYMTQNGNVDGKKDGDPITFEFSGDDDVWVFVDGKLVLDLGGIHDAVSGTIDFASGEVRVYKGLSKDNVTYTTTINTYIKDDMERGGNKLHNLQIFYLERGEGSSNCSIRCNLPIPNKLEVAKLLGNKDAKDEDLGSLKQQDFEFTLNSSNSQNGTYSPVANAEYTLLENNTIIEEDQRHSTDKDGKFKLKFNQKAIFSSLTLDKFYKVSETAFNNSTTSWETAKNGTGTQKGTGLETLPFQMEKNTTIDTYTCNFTNTCTSDVKDDVVVLDYGKKASIDVLANDTLFGATKVIKGIAKTKEDTLSNSSTSPLILTNGNASLNNDKTKLIYEPTKYMNSVDTLVYAVNIDNIDDKPDYYANVSIMPATSVYYEDDFGNVDNTGNIEIKYEGTWTPVAKSNKTENGDYQSSDNKQYGWDKSYENDSKFSNGSAHVTTINEKNPTATAEFTFTGTGVDIYTKTDSKTGTVKATLYKVENGKEEAQEGLIMDNKSISDKGNGYYQIPTLFFDNLNYGTYKVKITVTNQAGADRSTYYLDGIRVYNPLGVAPTDPIVKGAYKDAHEYNATYKKVRDILISAQDFNAGDITDGAVFIDEGKDENGNPSGNNGTTTTTIKTYEDIGPKNEVYLKKGQAIAFQINGGYDGLFIGAKAPNGTTTMVTTNSANAKETTIATASDMYYPITAKSITDSKDDSRYVMIKNTGDNILAITKIRATGENYTMKIKSPKEIANYASTFSQLKVSETDSSGMVLPEDKGDVDIDNPGDKDNDQNKDDNKDEDNNANKPDTIWNKIVNALKKWFGR